MHINYKENDVYDKFDKSIIYDLNKIFEAILEKAIKNISKRWAQPALEMYEGLQDHLDNWGSLSPKQCLVIANGCDYNGLVCTVDVVGRAIEAGYRGKQRDTDHKQHAMVELPIAVTITKAQLDMVMLDLAREIGEQAFERLRAEKYQR